MVSAANSIEACLLPDSTATRKDLEREIKAHVEKCQDSLVVGAHIMSFPGSDLLSKNLATLSIVQDSAEEDAVYGIQNTEDSRNCFSFHIYHLNDEISRLSIDEESEATVYTETILPAQDFEDLWDNLVFDDNQIKQKLLKYAHVSLLLSDMQVNPAIVALNRVILLYGEPGTGKTTLCRALAHKLAIRMSQRFTHGRLLEINTQALFSKWFSESGKLLMKMFDQIHRLLKESNAFVCVLIDEIESVAGSRTGLSGNEPSDSLRMVNTLLTQIDKLAKEPNCLILTTTNLCDSLDSAFKDRADLKQYIGLPGHGAVYSILAAGLMELFRVNLVTPLFQLLDSKTVSLIGRGTSSQTLLELDDLTSSACSSIDISLIVWNIAKKRHVIALQYHEDVYFKGMSGRALKKLSVIALIQCEVFPVNVIDYLKHLLIHNEGEKSPSR